MKIPAASYWRENTSWHAWLGKIGHVVVSTELHLSTPDQTAFLPYSFVLVDFQGMRKEFMGVPNEIFKTGDAVVCVFRKVSIPDETGIIHYGIKIKKI